MLRLTFPAAPRERDRNLISVGIIKGICLTHSLRKLQCAITTFIQFVLFGSRRPLNVTVSSMCGDNAPVIFKTGIFKDGAASDSIIQSIQLNTKPLYYSPD